MANGGVRHALDAAVDRAIRRPAYVGGFLMAGVALAVALTTVGRRLNR